jgi:DNA invertase Pin-like site-specific DNA recombinase
VRGAEKITSGHRERSALIYVRQSSLAQVRDNTESTARQYGLVEEAVRLGWARSAVEVIDADLGLSGRSAEHRSGYKELVGRVCLGEVGAIFGLEVSRLARSSADLSRLLELARLTDTLVVDADGIYELANFNDRLLLGLKGTMSEAELHLLAGRLQGAKRAAAERGELRFPLPVGYVYDDEGATVMDPDAEVAAAVTDSGHRRLRRFPRRRVRLPGRGRVQGPTLPIACLRRGVGRPAALGPAYPLPGARHPGQPRLRWHLRVRPLPLPPGGGSGRDGAHQAGRAGPPAVAGGHP